MNTTERQERHAREQAAIEACKVELAAHHKLPRDRKFEQAWALAWDYGHSAGFGEVKSHFADLVDLIRAGASPQPAPAGDWATEAVAHLNKSFGLELTGDGLVIAARIIRKHAPTQQQAEVGGDVGELVVSWDSTDRNTVVLICRANNKGRTVIYDGRGKDGFWRESHAASPRPESPEAQRGEAVLDIDRATDAISMALEKHKGPVKQIGAYWLEEAVRLLALFKSSALPAKGPGPRSDEALSLALVALERTLEGAPTFDGYYGPHRKAVAAIRALGIQPAKLDTPQGL